MKCQTVNSKAYFYVSTDGWENNVLLIWLGQIKYKEPFFIMRVCMGNNCVCLTDLNIHINQAFSTSALVTFSVTWLVWEALLCTGECSAASLASIHCITIASSLPSFDIKNISRHCYNCLLGGIHIHTQTYIHMHIFIYPHAQQWYQILAWYFQLHRFIF